MKALAGLLASVLLASAPAFGQQFKVKIINRHNSQTHYSYFVPGYSSAVSNTDLNCYGAGNSVNCSGSTTTNGVNVPGRGGSFDVTGATLALQLPDGRVAVVNCKSKFAEHFAGPEGNHRSCRIPLVDQIEANFKGDKAKLKWSVSLDGKKTESETYKVLGVLEAPKNP